MVLDRNLLSSEMLLDGDRVIRAALDRSVVSDDQDLAAGNTPDARDDSRAWRLAVIHFEGRQRRELEKGGARVDELADPLANRQLTLFAMTLKIFRSAALARVGDVASQVGHESAHPVLVGLEGPVGGRDVGFDYHPQQSVLNPHAGHRHTACMRYISAAPHRSQIILS